ncbi:MAG: hypothetical protein KIH63_004815, partial [Candidatus Saccharibacteria bacterium]|nr:hypothetical protein [Candidatus Saccharibacteria bacterium]
DIRGIDHLKELSVKYMEAKQQQREAQSQQPNEVEILAQTELQKTQMETEQRREAAQGVQANKAAELAIKEQETQIKFIEMLAKIEQGDKKDAIEKEKLAAEQARTAVELAVKTVKTLQGGNDD